MCSDTQVLKSSTLLVTWAHQLASSMISSSNQKRPLALANLIPVTLDLASHACCLISSSYNAQSTCANIMGSPACGLMLYCFAKHMPRDLQVQGSAVCGHPDGDINVLGNSQFVHTSSVLLVCRCFLLGLEPWDVSSSKTLPCWVWE